MNSYCSDVGFNAERRNVIEESYLEYARILRASSVEDAIYANGACMALQERCDKLNIHLINRSELRDLLNIH